MTRTNAPYQRAIELASATASLHVLPSELVPLAGFMLRHIMHAAEPCRSCKGLGTRVFVETPDKVQACPVCMGKRFVLPTPAEVLP